MLAACLAAAAVPARATPTDPTLALTAATCVTGTALRVLRVDGSFHAQDLVQIAYPLQLLVHVGASYVRFDLVSGTRTGLAPALADGLSADEAVALLGAGSPAPDGRILFLGAGRLEVALPESFPSGAAEAQLFVVDEGEPVLSNALSVAIGPAP